MSPEQRRVEMKNRNIKANEKLRILHNDPEWVQTKGRNISKALAERGGHKGSNNPMSGRKHQQSSREKQSMRARLRDPNCYDRATESKIANGNAIPKDKKEPFIAYKEEVQKITLRSWKEYQQVINPNNLPRGKDYELDHKYSITQGFLDSIPPAIIGHYQNLQLIPRLANRSKRIKCSILLEELLKLVKSEDGPI